MTTADTESACMATENYYSCASENRSEKVESASPRNRSRAALIWTLIPRRPANSWKEELLNMIAQATDTRRWCADA